jgi:hypothetical protein
MRLVIRSRSIVSSRAVSGLSNLRGSGVAVRYRKQRGLRLATIPLALGVLEDVDALSHCSRS